MRKINLLILILMGFIYVSFGKISQIKVPEVVFPIEIENKKIEHKPPIYPPKKLNYQVSLKMIIISKEIPPYPPYDVPPVIGELNKPKVTFGFPRKNALLASAINDYERGLYISAEDKLKKIIEKYTEDPVAAKALYLLGLIEYKLKNEQKSQKFFELACNFKGEFDLKEESCLSAVIMYLKTRDYEKAQKTFSKIYLPQYKNDYLLWKGVLLILNNKKDEAFELLKPLKCTDVEINTVNYCRYTKSYIYLYKKLYNDSLKYTTGFGEKSPYFKHILLISGFDYIGIGDYDAAQDKFERYLAYFGKIDKLSDFTLYGLGFVYLGKGDLKSAEKMASVLETRDTILSQNLYVKLAEKYANKGDYETAYILIQKALNVSPEYKQIIKKKVAISAYNIGKYKYALNIMKTINDPLFKLYAGYAAIYAKDYKTAEKMLKEAFYHAKDPKIKEQALKFLAEIYYQNKQLELLKSVAKVLKKYDPIYADDLLGWYYFEKGDYKKAYQHFHDNYMKAVSAFNAGMIDTAYKLIKDKTDRKSLFLKSYIHLSKGDIQKRRDILKKLAKGNDDIAVKSAYLYAYSFFATGDYRRAIKEFQKFIKKYPNTDLAKKSILRIGDSYYNLGQVEKARKIYKNFIKKYANSPEAIDAAYQLTVLEMKSSKGSVIQQIEDFIKRYPNYPFVNLLKLQLAEAYIDKGEYKKAEKIYIDLIKSKANESEYAWYKLGYLYYKMGNIDKAKRVLKAYLKRYKKGNFAISAKELLATIYEEEGDIQNAIKYYESLPKTDNALFKLATLLFKVGDYAKAKKYFLKLYNKYPDMKNDLAYYLGKIEFKLGNYKNAIKYLNEATQGNDYKHVAESYYLLAEIYKQTGAKDKALNNYLNVIYLYPNAKDTVIKARIEASEILQEEGKKEEASCIIKPLLKSEDQTIFNLVVQKLKELPRCNR